MAERTPYERLAEQIGAGESKLIPRIFEALTDEKEAAFLLAAAPPATVDEIAEKTGIATDEISGMVDPLFRKGLLFKSKKKEAVRYYRVRHVMQMHDSTAVAENPSREMLDLWKEVMEAEWEGFVRQLEKVIPAAPLRVIPVNVSIEGNTQILASEDVRNLIDSAVNIAVTKCSCRVIDGACGKSLEVCIQLDRAADYAIERGTGRKLSKREAMEMLRSCEEEGLIHTTENKRARGHVICNCCGDCCINWPTFGTEMKKFVAPSRFRALVESDDCTGCAECVDRCFFGAISMEGGDGLAAIDSEECVGCGLCQVVCPTDAINLQAVRPEEFVPA